MLHLLCKEQYDSLKCFILQYKRSAIRSQGVSTFSLSPRDESLGYARLHDCRMMFILLKSQEYLANRILSGKSIDHSPKIDS